MFRPITSRSALMQSRHTPLVPVASPSIFIFRSQKIVFRGQFDVPLQVWVPPHQAATAHFSISIILLSVITDHNPSGSKPASLRILIYTPLLDSGEQIAETEEVRHWVQYC